VKIEGPRALKGPAAKAGDRQGIFPALIRSAHPWLKPWAWPGPDTKLSGAARQAQSLPGFRFKPHDR